MPNKKKESQIFISYAREDDEPFVNKLHKDLKKNGIEVWWDKVSMRSRGRTFLHEIREAIDKSERVIAVIGPNALKSDYVWYEWEHGFVYSKALVPILREGNYKETLKELVELNTSDFFEKHPSEFIPEYVLNLHCIDFREDRKEKYKKALSELCSSIKEEIELGVVHEEVLDLPPHYVPRPEVLRDLSNTVFEDIEKTVTIKPEKRITAIHGRGGAGKTIVAAAFARSVNTRRVFKDGIIWLKIGQKPNLLKQAKLLGMFFTEDKGGKIFKYVGNLEDAQRKLKRVLANKTCLIVLDDVWDGNYVEYFKEALGRNCRLIFTTRDEGIPVDLGAHCNSLEEISDAQAKRLLSDWSGIEPEKLPEEAFEVANVCDRLPIALAICGAIFAAARLNWTQILSAVKKAKTNLLKRKFYHYSKEDLSIFSPLQVSLNYLKKLDNENRSKKEPYVERYKHYIEMAAFGSEVLTPESVIIALWLLKNQLEEDDLTDLIGFLINRALVQKKTGDKPPTREVSLHNLQQVYLAKILGEKKVIRLHIDIGKALMDWWIKNKNIKQKGPEEKQKENYILSHLIFHLIECKDFKGLKKILTDIKYLKRKQNIKLQPYFQNEFTSLITNPSVPEKQIENILGSIHNVIKTKLSLSKAKADWLDTFAYWLTEFGDKKISDSRATILETMSKKFDETCGDVSKKLVSKYKREGKSDYAMRFAELYTWVYQRSGDFGGCVKACQFAENMCREKGMPVAYQNLGKAEFIRMRAFAYKKLKNIDLAYKAYEDLNREFSFNIWTPDVKEWEKLEGDQGIVLKPPSQKDKGKPKDFKFKARVVSNAHDCIGAIHIIRYFLENKGLVEWIHHKKFKSKQLASDDLLFTVLLGGPKAPEISDVAYDFYKYSKENEQTYLRMYSGLYIEANRLEMEKENTYCYMLGGISKVNTLMAAYDFTKDDQVKNIIIQARKRGKK